MAHWGEALALGPFYNKPWEAFRDDELAQVLPAARVAMRRAQLAAANGPTVERALAAALAARYQADEVTDRAVLDQRTDGYADAMGAVHAEFQEDLEVAALCATALMQRTPWRLWDTATGLAAADVDTSEIVEILERGLAVAGSTNTRHPGLLHLHVHALELAPHPELAKRSAHCSSSRVTRSRRCRRISKISVTHPARRARSSPPQRVGSNGCCGVPRSPRASERAGLDARPPRARGCAGRPGDHRVVFLPPGRASSSRAARAC